MTTAVRRLGRAPVETALAAAAITVAVANVAKVTGWGWFWLGWGSLGLAVELFWVIDNAANTLSRQFWGVEGLDLAHPLDFAEWKPAHWIIAVLLWGTFAWLSVHLTTGLIR